MSAPAHPTIDDTIVGWREWVRLTAYDVPWIKAKVDTGAKTSSLHAFELTESSDAAGAPTVTFQIHPWQATDLDAVTVTLPVHDRRLVRSSSGHAEERLVVLDAGAPLALAVARVFVGMCSHELGNDAFRVLRGEGTVPKEVAVAS